MSPILSRPTPVLDGSAAGFRRAAGDLGEAIAVLSGGLPPDQWTRSRLAQALREIQSFLVAEAHEHRPAAETGCRHGTHEAARSRRVLRNSDGYRHDDRSFH